MTTSATTSASTFNPATSANISKSKANRKNLLSRILIGILAGIVLLSFLMPLGYMFSTGLKSKEQMSDPNAPVLWPFSQETFTYNGEELPVYQVPIDNRTVDLAAVNKTRTATTSWLGVRFSKLEDQALISSATASLSGRRTPSWVSSSTSSRSIYCADVVARVTPCA